MEIPVPPIQRGGEEGEFRPVDPMEVNIADGAIIEGTMLLRVCDKSMIDSEGNTRSGIELLLVGLGP